MTDGKSPNKKKKKRGRPSKKDIEKAEKEKPDTRAYLPEEWDCPYPECEFVGKNVAGIKAHLRTMHQMPREAVDQIMAACGADMTKLRLEVRKYLKALGITPELLQKMKEFGEDWVIPPPPSQIDQQEPPVNFSEQSLPIIKKEPEPQRRKQIMQGDEPVEPTKLSHLKGELRQLLKRMAKLPTEKRDSLYPEREQTMDLLKRLAKISTEGEFMEIETAYMDRVKPSTETKIAETSPIAAGSGSTTAASRDIHMTANHAKTSSKVRSLIKRIANMDERKQEDLDRERETLYAMSRRLGAASITDPDMREINSLIDNEIVPIINATEHKKRDRPRALADDAEFDDWLDESYKMKNTEWKMMRMDRMMADEQERFDMVRTRGKPMDGSGVPPGMVPVSVPRIDPATGEMETDASGRPVMETTYKPIGATGGDPNMAIILKAALEGNKGDNSMIPLLVSMMDNNSKTLIAMMTQDKGTDVEKLMLQMQNNTQQMMSDMQKMTSDKDSQMQLALGQMRDQQTETLNQLHATEMGSVRKEMDEMRQYAFQDPIDKMLNQKEKLKALGVVTDPREGDASAEEKMVEEVGKAVSEMGNRVDQGITGMTELLKPLTQAQARYMEQAAEAKAPRKMSERQKISHYHGILKQLDGTIEREDEEEDVEE